MASASNKVIEADKKSSKSTVSSKVSVMLPVFISISNVSSTGSKLSGTRVSGYSNLSTVSLSSFKVAAKFVAMSATIVLLNLIIQLVASVQSS